MWIYFITNKDLCILSFLKCLAVSKVGASNVGIVIKQRPVCLERNLCHDSNSSKSMLVFLEIVPAALAKNTPLFEAVD
jgi:hypothetical protein